MASTDPPIRHIPWAYTTGDGFGHHYITKDPALPTADQFDIAVFPRGDKSRLGGDPLRDTPHIRIRTWDGTNWHEASITPIGKPESVTLQFPGFPPIRGVGPSITAIEN